MISLYDNWIQKFIFEILEISLNKVNSDKKFFLLKIIYNNIDKCDDSTIFLGLNSLSRIEVIIAEIIQDISKEDFSEFEQILQKNNSNLYLIQQIIYWLGTPSKGGINKDQLINKLEKIYKNKIDKIINNIINILDNNNYVKKNLWGLYHGTKDNENLIKEYMKNILNENTIFRFLNEMISRSLGTKFGYKISDESINYFTTRENIDNILINIKKELTDDEKLLINLFYNHNSKKDELYLDFDKKFNV